MRRRIVQILAAIGALAILCGLVGAIAAWGFVRTGLSSRPEPSSFEQRLALWLREITVPERYKGMKNPIVADDAVIARAKAHWADHCATCHANDGRGDTEMGRKMYPRPPDMRSARTQTMSDGEIYRAINQGVRLTGMPAWGDPGDDDRASWELVAFIRALPALTQAEVEAMAALNPVPADVVKARNEREKEDAFLGGDGESPPSHGKH